VSEGRGPDSATIERAGHPDLRIGRGILERELHLPGRVALLTQPGPLEALPDGLAARFDRVVLVDSLAADALVALEAGLGDVDGIVGLGGGMTMDAAKHVAWRRSVPLVLAPSIVSVDAAVTNTVAVRREGRVVYEGFVVADRIVADLDLISRAPVRLNRAGVGDLLSIHTALGDWRLAASNPAAGPRALAYDDEIAERSAAVLARLLTLAHDVHGVTDAALEAILRGYAEVNALCLAAGHSGPEEGSEHYLAYRIEAMTGRSFVHGELVGLGVVLMARLQDRDAPAVTRFLDGCGVAWRPGALGLERETLVEALTGLAAFAAAAALPWSIADERPIDRPLAEALIAGM
jgi:glycerol-1-phosphate dehydrogenase [NAD(P)+]